MKEYIIDDNEAIIKDGKRIGKAFISVCYWESSDCDNNPEIAFEQQNWSKDRVTTQLVAGVCIKGVPPISIRRTEIYEDNTSKIESEFWLDPVAAYSLYLHFKKIDEAHPD